MGESVITALGFFSDPRTVPLLIISFNHGYEREASYALKKIGTAAVEPLLSEVEKGNLDAISILEEIDVSNQKIVNALIIALKNNSSSIRESAAKKLESIGNQQAVEPLLDVLDDGEWKVRIAVAKALMKIATFQIKERVIKHLDDLTQVQETQSNLSMHREKLLSLPIVKIPYDCHSSLLIIEVEPRLAGKVVSFTNQACVFVDSNTSKGHYNEYSGLHDIDTKITTHTISRIGDYEFCETISSTTSTEKGTYENQDI